jgi:acetolactate synthase I/II/III large subunit
MLRLLGIEYASVLPGASFRGIHDSAVNYTLNSRPELILCNHEAMTVALARGYAKVSGRPMVAMVHNVVGLLNASMAINGAWVDRAPVIVIGGTGPMDATLRRPGVDWLHTANVQGNIVRDYTKWDDQPASVAAIPEAVLRAYRIATTDPAGPVYLCFDVTHQEEKLAGEFQLPDVNRFRPAVPPGPDPAAIRQAAQTLLGAELPLCFAERMGRHPTAVPLLVELAELLAMPVIDLVTRINFPALHPLDFAGLERELLPDADVVLGLDSNTLDGAMRPSREGAAKPVVDGKQIVTISLDEYAHRGGTSDYQALPHADLAMLADTQVALPLLLEECRSRMDSAARGRIDRRRATLAGRQAALRDRQRQYMARQWDRPHISEARLMAELWEAVKDDEFTFTYGLPRNLAPGVCGIAGPEQHIGYEPWVGEAAGVSLGAGLALRDRGRLPVAVMGDGDLFMGIQAFWTAAHYGIPGLWVTKNNRSYFNDEMHQDHVARDRDRLVENCWIAQRMESPEVDFAGIARLFGHVGEGPIIGAADLQPAFRRALDAVKRGQLAVVDVWTENREAA